MLWVFSANTRFSIPVNKLDLLRILWIFTAHAYGRRIIFAIPEPECIFILKSSAIKQTSGKIQI